jgi:hypothetical protein
MAPLASLVFMFGLFLGMLSVDSEAETVAVVHATAAQPDAEVQPDAEPPPQQQPAAASSSACRPASPQLPRFDAAPYRRMLGGAAAWAEANVPLFECSDADVTQAYYYRWQLFWRHLQWSNEDGWTLSEFLPHVNWAGPHGTINCACESRRAHVRIFSPDFCTVPRPSS